MKSNFSIWIFSRCLQFFLALIFATCKWKVNNLDYFIKQSKSDSPILLCSWHSRFLFVARFFKTFPIEIWGISSEHRDSEIMAKILQNWNWKLIRGSSTRGWRHVIRQMKTKLNDSAAVIAITNDGPKGPPRTAKRGSVSLAMQHNAHIISMSCSSSRFWELPSWDKTRVPKPFSTVYITFDSAMDYNNASNEVEDLNTYLNTNLDHLDRSIHRV